MDGAATNRVEEHKAATYLCAGISGFFLCGHWTSQMEKYIDKILFIHMTV